MDMIKTWVMARMKERTSLDGALMAALGLLVALGGPMTDIAAWVAVAYGAWTLWKAE
jgi:hypothetical protein